MFPTTDRMRVVSPNWEDLRKRARILVIDDEEFPYEVLLRTDGYDIVRWPAIEDLNRLVDHTYDVIVLDIHGVGLTHDPDRQGLGILEYIKQHQPLQPVLAISSMKAYSLSETPVLALADRQLPKSVSYLEFRNAVDDMIKRRADPMSYVRDAASLVAQSQPDLKVRDRLLLRALKTSRSGRLERSLTRQGVDRATVDRVVALLALGHQVMTGE